jgi:phosphatidylglycerol:prolipoprotein diacylglycerol transferase
VRGDRAGIALTQKRSKQPTGASSIRRAGGREGSSTDRLSGPAAQIPAAFRRPGTTAYLPSKSRATADVRAAKPVSRRRSRDHAAAFFALPVDEKHLAERGRLASFLDHQGGPHALAATYAFQAPATGDAYGLVVRFLGMRKDISGPPGAQDHFSRTERLEGLVADGNRVALTTRVSNVNPGEWRVVMEPVEASENLDPSDFPRRVVETHTQFGLLAQGPSVRLTAWPILVGIGVIVALVLQGLLAGRAGLSVPLVLGISGAGSLLGFLGGKAWYLGLHKKPLREFLHAGACIQGFLVVGLGTLAGGSLLVGLPVGTVLDVTTPGIFLAVAIGRPGCFFTGCCAGRPTASRWGLLSSDRRLLVRRLPVQLYEAAAGLLLGVIALLLVLLSVPAVPGALFIGAVAAYTLIRQLLFPARVESRTRGGRFVTLGASALFVVGALAVSAS